MKSMKYEGLSQINLSNSKDQNCAANNDRYEETEPNSMNTITQHDGGGGGTLGSVKEGKFTRSLAAAMVGTTPDLKKGL